MENPSDTDFTAAIIKHIQLFQVNDVSLQKTAENILANVKEGITAYIKQRMDLFPDDPAPSERAAYDAYLNVLNHLKKCNSQKPKP